MGCLVCEKLTKIYVGKSKALALDNVNFSVETKGIFALIGRNGAGKTTLIRILATELEQTVGTASINGYDIKTQANDLRKKIAIVPQEARTIRWMTPKQTVFSYLLWRGYGYSQAKKVADEALKKMGLEQYKDVLNDHLSGGTKRKVLIATVTASDAEIIFLDEPTTGLDPVSRRALWGILREISKERFIFLTTHYLEEAEHLADSIGILNNGKLVSIGTLNELRNKSKHQYSIRTSSFMPASQLQNGVVTRGESAVTQIMANEAEAFEIARSFSDQKRKFSINPITLDDIFFELVGQRSREE